MPLSIKNGIRTQTFLVSSKDLWGLWKRQLIQGITTPGIRPEKTPLYQIIQSNLTKFIDQVEAEKGYPLPNFVIKEFCDYLDCGILAKGFLRLHCESCGADGFVVFSCKRRVFLYSLKPFEYLFKCLITPVEGQNLHVYWQFCFISNNKYGKVSLDTNLLI